MSSTPKTSRPELPKSILGRIAFGAVCLPLLAFSAVFLYAFFYGIFSGRKLCDTVEGYVAHGLAEPSSKAFFSSRSWGLSGQ